MGSMLIVISRQYGTDFEIGMGDAFWSTIEAAAQAASKATAVFDYSAYYLCIKQMSRIRMHMFANSCALFVILCVP